MVVFIKTCGFKNTFKLVWQYPAMILTPIFTFWTMGPKKTASTKKSCCGYWSSNDLRIGVSFFYSFLNCFMTVSGSLFCLLITHQNPYFFQCSFYDSPTCGYFHFGLIVISVLLPLALIFTLVLKCKRKSLCCGVALSNVQHFDINEWDVIEVEKEQDQEIEIIIRNVAKDTSVHYSAGTVLMCCGVVKCVSDINELHVKEDELSEHKDELSEHKDEVSEHKDELSEHKEGLEMTEFLAPKSVTRKIFNIPNDFM